MRWLLFLILILCMIYPVQASWSELNSTNWAGNLTHDNTTTNPISIVPAASADFANRANSADMNGNTLKTKWWEFTNGLKIIDNVFGEVGHYGTANDNDSASLSLYNVTFTLTDNGSVSLYIYTNRTDFTESGVTNNGKGYRLYFNPPLGDINYHYVNLSRESIDNYYGTNYAFQKNDVMTVDATTSSMKIYKNGTLLDTFNSNTSFSSGGVCLSSHTYSADSKFDNYFIALQNHGNATTTTQDAGVSNAVTKVLSNGTYDANRTVELWINSSNNADMSGSTGWTQLSASISTNTEYSVAAGYQKRYFQVREVLTSVNYYQLPEVDNLRFKFEATGPAAPSITNYAPSTPNSSYANVDKDFNFTSDQTGNHTYYMNGDLVQTNLSVTDSTYTNTSENNTGLSGLQNLTMIVTNANGSDSQKIDWTLNVPYMTTNVTYDNRSNLSYNRIFNIEEITPGIVNISIGYGNTDNGNNYGLYFSNDTQIATTQTATSENETVWFNSTVAVFIVADGYYINEAEPAPSAIEIFVNPPFVATSGAAVLIASFFYVTSWINRRRRRW